MRNTFFYVGGALLLGLAASLPAASSPADGNDPGYQADDRPIRVWRLGWTLDLCSGGLLARLRSLSSKSDPGQHRRQRNVGEVQLSAPHPGREAGLGIALIRNAREQGYPGLIMFSSPRRRLIRMEVIRRRYWKGTATRWISPLATALQHFHHLPGGRRFVAVAFQPFI